MIFDGNKVNNKVVVFCYHWNFTKDDNGLRESLMDRIGSSKEEAIAVHAKSRWALFICIFIRDRLACLCV